MGLLMNDWDSLREPLEAACATPDDEETIKNAVQSAELVASAAGEPPDALPDDARDWVERHGVPPDDLIELAVRAMKQVAVADDWWHERLQDLRFRLGDIAAA
jgi:Domain of unknown function (DUF4259)